MKKLKIIFFIFLFCTNQSYSQAPVLQWKRYYDPPGTLNSYSTIAIGMVTDNQANVYVTGYYRSGTSPVQYVFVMKYNSSGAQQWIHVYAPDSSIETTVVGIGLDSLNNVYIGGTEDSLGNTSFWNKVYVIKYTSSGSQIWLSKKYYTPGGISYAANAMVVDKGGNVYLTGKVNSAYYYCATYKVDTYGNFVWTEIFFNQNTEGKKICMDASGYVYVFLKNFPRIRKYNPAGGNMWTYTYPNLSLNIQEITSVDIDMAGNVYFAFSYVYQTLDRSRIVKLLSNGYQEFDIPDSIYAINPVISSKVSMIKSDSVGYIYIIGQNDTTGFNSVGMISKIDTTGNFYWSNFTASSDNSSLCFNGLNNIYVRSENGNIFNYDPAGNLVWTTVYINYYSGFIEYCPPGIIYSFGIDFTNIPGGYNVSKFNFNITTGIDEYDDIKNSCIIQPNLFHDKSTFYFPNYLNSNKTELFIYNLSGKRLKQISITGSFTELNGSDLASGIYFYKVIKNDETFEAGKFIIH